jgi:nucleoside-diphosphate-sugar epimerase
LAILVSEATGVDAEIVYEPPRTGDLRQSYACIEKAEKALGYELTVTLKDGLQNLIHESKEKESQNHAVSRL